MKRPYLLLLILLIAFTCQYSIANAIERSQIIYANEPGTITRINDNPPVNPVRVTLCSNAENSTGLMAKSSIVYRNITFIETAWAYSGDSVVISNNIPALVLTDALWYCYKSVTAIPNSGYIIFKFDY